jgi:hypothetical protein
MPSTRPRIVVDPAGTAGRGGPTLRLPSVAFPPTVHAALTTTSDNRRASATTKGLHQHV